MKRLSINVVLSLSNPGDRFTAGDYEVMITDITAGGPTGYSGRGYVKFKFLGQIQLAQVSVLLDNVVVNNCYQHIGGRVISEYDPQWKGVLDLDEGLEGIKKIIELFGDFVPKTLDWMNMDGVGDEYINAGNELLNELKVFKNSLENSNDFDSELKTATLNDYNLSIIELEGLINILRTSNANFKKAGSNNYSESFSQLVTEKKLATIQAISKAESSTWERFKSWVSSFGCGSIGEYFDQEGIVPQCMWKNAPFVPRNIALEAGVIDGVWNNTIGNITGLIKILNLNNCFSRPSDWSVERGGIVVFNESRAPLAPLSIRGSPYSKVLAKVMCLVARHQQSG